MEDRLNASSMMPVPTSESRHESTIALGGLVALFMATLVWWGLAFWPVQDAPAWLERTRFVCFGVAESGLPDGTGWIGLIGGPLGMATIFVVGWGRGLRLLLQRARSSTAIAGVLALLGIATTLLPVAAAARVRQATGDAGTIELEPPSAVDFRRLDREAPPLSLVAHDGATKSLEQFRGRPVLVTFAYAHCETVCPLVVRDVLATRDLLRSSGATPSELPAILIVTLDPWRDTASRLPAMAAAWHLPAEDAWVLGGDVAAVEATLDAWQVPRTRDLQSGEVTHPSLVYVVDANGRIAFIASGGTTVLADLLRRL